VLLSGDFAEWGEIEFDLIESSAHTLAVLHDEAGYTGAQCSPQQQHRAIQQSTDRASQHGSGPATD
jgi:glycerophosphoryl diester phosphodiesterase